MGDIADMMLEGTLCAGCGVYIGKGDMGIPMYCSKDCEPNDYSRPSNKKEKIKCPICNKKCGGEQGLKAHTNAIHKEE